MLRQVITFVTKLGHQQILNKYGRGVRLRRNKVSSGPDNYLDYLDTTYMVLNIDCRIF